MRGDDLFFCQEIQSKHQRQQHIDKACQHRACCPQRHSENSAALRMQQSRDLAHHQIGVRRIFRQNDAVSGGKLYRACPPLPQLFNVAGQVLHKFVAGFPQARQHHKHHGKHDPQHQQRAQRQADGAGQLFGRFFADAVPSALQRAQQNVDDKGKRAAHQKRGQHPQHPAQKLQHALQIDQRPRKHKRKQQRAEDIACGFFIQNDRPRGGIGLGGVRCFFDHGFLPVRKNCVSYIISTARLDRSRT